MSVRPSVPSLDSSSDMLLVCCLYRLSIDVCLLLQPGRGQQTSIDIDVSFLCVLLMYIFILCFIFGRNLALFCATILINLLTYFSIAAGAKARAAGGVVVVTRGGGGSTPTCRVYRLPAGRPALGPRQRGGSAR